MSINMGAKKYWLCTELVDSWVFSRKLCHIPSVWWRFLFVFITRVVRYPPPTYLSVPHMPVFDMVLISVSKNIWSFSVDCKSTFVLVWDAGAFVTSSDWKYTFSSKPSGVVYVVCTVCIDCMFECFYVCFLFPFCHCKELS